MTTTTRVAWITGGSKGIGFASAVALGKAGYQVAISARNADELSAAALELEAKGIKALAVPCDVAVAESVEKANRAIVENWGPVELLVNNAGVSPWSTFSEMTVEEFDQAIAINVRGMFLCSKLVLPGMYERKSGAIVQMLSVASTKAYRNGAGYVASKFAALGLTNAIREEARKHGVRVLSVIPGAVETELWGPEERERFHEKMMQPEDIGRAIVDALALPARSLVEEIVIRPMVGDL